MEEIEILKTQIKKLENQSKEIDKQVNTLYKKRNSICTEIKKLEYEVEKIQFSELNTKEDNWYASIPESEFDHYNIFELLKVTARKAHNVEYVRYTYYSADNDLSFSCYASCRTKRGFIQLIANNNFRQITNASAELLIQIGLNCKEHELPDIHYITNKGE